MVTAKLMTVEDVLALPEDEQGELIDGVFKPMVPVSGGHGRIESEIVHLLLNWSDTQASAGEVLSGGPGFILSRNPDNLVGPDVAYLRAGREALLDQRGFMDATPDLAVEVLSPSNTASEMADKVNRYLKAGTEVVWVVDPDRRSVTVYERGGTFRVLAEDATLLGDDLLPGFTCRVGDFFRRRGKTP